MKLAVVICTIIVLAVGFFFIYNQVNVTGSTITGGSVIGPEDLSTESAREITINASRLCRTLTQNMESPSLILMCVEKNLLNLLLQRKGLTHSIVECTAVLDIQKCRELSLLNNGI